MRILSENQLGKRYGQHAVAAFYRRAAERRAKGEALTESDVLEAMRGEHEADPDECMERHVAEGPIQRETSSARDIMEPVPAPEASGKMGDEEDDQYFRVVRIVSEAMQRMVAANLDRIAIFAALVDSVAIYAMRIGGEPALRDAAERMESVRVASTTNGASGNAGADDAYDRVIAKITEVMSSAARSGATLEQFQDALVDFTAAIALILDGEELLQAFIARMESRIDEWHAGTFPFDDSNKKHVPGPVIKRFISGDLNRQ